MIANYSAAIMARSLQLALLLITPIAVLAAIVALDRALAAPERHQDYVVRIQLPPVDGPVGLPEIWGPPDASRPLVVLDPGHGGHDPGAARDGALEKALALDIARAIRDSLLAEGGIRVAMTREEDRFLMLAERSSIARRLGADLFLSVHADSAENPAARGASVYVLSERGSSEAAAKIAARENKSDTLNGVVMTDRSDAVSAILLDLSQREAQAGSYEVARLILRELDGQVRLHNREVQSGAFAVLKAPDVPSVLLESGYISNPDDAAYLLSDAGRQAIAQATARAVRVYVARRSGL